MVFIPKYGFCGEIFDYDPTTTIQLKTFFKKEIEMQIYVTDSFRRSYTSLAYSSQNGDIIKGKRLIRNDTNFACNILNLQS